MSAGVESLRVLFCPYTTGAVPEAGFFAYRRTDLVILTFGVALVARLTFRN